MIPKGLPALEGMEYPGRVIIVGRDPRGEHDVVIYALTGRSRSSQARKLVDDGKGTIKIQVAGWEQLKMEDRRLLIYTCIKKIPHGLVVSNGAQTDLIVRTIENLKGRGLCPAPLEILRRAFAWPYLAGRDDASRGIDLTSYEPDEPIYTPRISGCLLNGAALSIVRRSPDGSPERDYFAVPLSPGRGKLIATYAGENVDPLPSFRGRPIDVSLETHTPEELANAVYSSLAPADRQKDLRVGVATIWSHLKTGETQVSIRNRSERER